MRKVKPILPLPHDQHTQSPPHVGLISRIAGELWSNQMLADAFMKDSKGWQKDLAAILSVSANDIETSITAYGARLFRKTLANNPAGEPPAEVAAKPVRRDHGISMNTDAQYCETGNSCGTCNSKCFTCITPKSAYVL